MTLIVEIMKWNFNNFLFYHYFVINILIVIIFTMLQLNLKTPYVHNGIILSHFRRVLEKWVFAVFVSKYSFRGVSTYKNSAELRFCAVWEYDLSEICIWGQKLFCSLCIWGYHGIISVANYLPVLLILINQAAEFSQKRSVATCSVEYLKNDFCSRVK